MAKYIGVIFPRKSRDSDQNAAARQYGIQAELRKTLGQAKSILFHGFVHGRSTNGRLGFAAYEGCLPGSSPSEDGFSVTPTGTYSAITTGGPFKFVVPGDFMGELEIIAKVDGTQAGNVESVEFELFATLLEE